MKSSVVKTEDAILPLQNIFPCLGQPIFLQTTVGLVGDGVFNQALFHQVPDKVIEITRSTGLAAFFCNFLFTKSLMIQGTEHPLRHF